jgi:HlyD family secretion protein
MTKFYWLIGLLIAGVGGFLYISKNRANDAGDIEYRYAKVQKGEIVRSISATGTLVASTMVDIKSKAGGKVVRLAVDEGTMVKKGDLIAVIDPSDTQATYDQASADLTSAQARAAQAEANFRLQQANSKTAVADAQAALETARVRLSRARLELQRTPTLTAAATKTAQAAYDEAVEAKKRFEQVTVPQRRRDAQGNFDRTKADFEVAQAEYDRQVRLLEQGFTTQAVLDKSRSALQSARSAFQLAQTQLNTNERDLDAELVGINAAISRAKAQLDQARAGTSDTAIQKQNVAEAEKAVKTAGINLQQAKDSQINNRIRGEEYRAAKASTVRSRVSVENAKVQLDSTTVLAPRDGVVTTKYLEEGTIIPPGTSTFAQGTSIVQLSDVNTMFVECAVVEADVAQVRAGQKVRIVTEAFKGVPVAGVVDRVNPAAKTENNITAVKVRVKILPGSKARLLPGMTATCEFLTLEKPNVLVAPSQAIYHEGDQAYVDVKTADPLMPKRVEVKVGEVGNDGTEIISGLKEGDEIVTAKIDLAALRETQKKMQEAQEGGGLMGGQGPRNNQTRPGQPRAGASLNMGSGRSGSGGGGGGAGGRR